jgi:tetratricopeptide (TPR) repeat protein
MMLNGKLAPVAPEGLDPELSAAVAAHLAGDLDRARAAYHDLLDRRPGDADVTGLLAVLAYQAGRPDAALDLCDRALATAPDRGRIHHYRGAALRQLGRAAEAVDAYNRALELGVDDPGLRHALIATLVDARRGDEGLAMVDAALARDPGDVASGILRARALLQLARVDAAEEQLARLIASDPKEPETRYLMGLALREQNRLDEAIAVAEALLVDFPSANQARLELAEMRLLRGDFASAWPEYEWRYHLPHTRGILPRFDGPAWDGSPLAGRTLFVYVEQGYGDSIMFARFLARIDKQGGRLTLGVSPALLPLFTQLPNVDRVITDWMHAAPFDLHLPISSLPHRLGLTLDDLPGPLPYLAADPARVAAFKPRFGQREGRRVVGLVWTGRPENPNDAKRSVPPAELARLVALPDVMLVAMQRGVPAPEPLVAAGAIDLGAAIHDFADLAAVIDQLDLLVSVDTAAAHLAGALGKQTEVLLPFAPDWRWRLANVDRSDWYASMRLHRQPRLGDWTGAVDRLLAALGE